MTRISLEKRSRILEKYRLFEEKAKRSYENGNMPMYEVYQHKLKAIRMTLSLLEIHIVGINKVGIHEI